MTDSVNSLQVETSEDDFHRGAFKALQPVGTGHRAGLDALLIAASLPEDASGNLADLGSGSGVAGLAAIATNPRLCVHLVEKNPLMVDLARRTLKIRQNLQYASRAKVIEADVTLSGAKRLAAGLKEEFYDFVIMNPPYNHDGQRVSPDGIRAEAHVMGAFGLDAWMRTAVAILKPGGTLVLVYRTEKIGEIYACCQGRFGGQVVVPVHSRLEEPAKRILVKMTKGSRAPLSIMPGLVMHGSDGKPTTMADDLLNGEARVNFG
ncbi:MAG: methyltransferase [Salaquimonas sp.]